MKIKCDECGTILCNPPVTTQSIECMEIINHEQEYMKEKEELIGRFFFKYSKEINLIKGIENNIIRKYLDRLKSLNSEKHQVAQKFDELIMNDFKEWKLKQ